MGDCFTSADPDAKKQKCVGTKGFSPDHLPSIVRALTRLISDQKVPAPSAIFVASNWAGIFKALPRELWHAHGVTRLFGWSDLQGRVGGEFKDFNVVALEQEVLRFSDGGAVLGLHSTLALWTAQKRWLGFGDELTQVGDSKYDPNRHTRSVFALEELHVKEDEIWRTSLALTGSPVDIFNDTVTNAVCVAGHPYPPNACPCAALRQEYGVVSGRGFGSLPKHLHKAWGLLKCDSVLCEPLRPRDVIAARNGERFPCKRRFYDDVLRFSSDQGSSKGSKPKKKKKLVQIK